MSGCATPHGRGGLEALARDLKGRLLQPNDEAYPLAAWPNNARWAHVHPEAVAICADAGDVQKCVEWVRGEKKPFAIRSGGHSYAGFSTTTGLLIDVKRMNGVSFDARTGLATVGGGASNQDVANAMNRTPFAIPSGRCPTVGTSGLVLGGGWGFAATRHGLTCDNLVSTDIVTADGRLRTVGLDSRDDDAKLFWALRGGGGGNFGVNTSFTFQTHAVPDVTVFNVAWPGGKQVELMLELQKIQNANAKDISTRSKVVPLHANKHPQRSDLAVQTLGLYWGDPARLRQVMDPAFTILPPAQTDIHEMSYWQARDYMATDDPNGLYDMNSRYIGESMSAQGIEMMLTHMSRWPGGSVVQQNMGILFAVGGRVRDVPVRATAYPHRESNFIFEMEMMWAPIDGPRAVSAQKAWLMDYFNAMQAFVHDRSYVNFPSRNLGSSWGRAYYGPNLRDLEHVKYIFDPRSVFSFEQSIKPVR